MVGLEGSHHCLVKTDPVASASLLDHCTGQWTLSRGGRGGRGVTSRLKWPGANVAALSLSSHGAVTLGPACSDDAAIR